MVLKKLTTANKIAAKKIEKSTLKAFFLSNFLSSSPQRIDPAWKEQCQVGRDRRRRQTQNHVDNHRRGGMT